MGNGIDNISILIVLLVVFLFILTWGFNRISILRIRRKSEQAKDLSIIMTHTLNMSNNSVLRLSIRDHFAVNMHGNFLPEEGMSYEESLNYIHPEDRFFYIDFCKKLVAGKKTSQCVFRWDVNRGHGEQEWRYFRDLGIAEYANPNMKTPTNIFCVLTDLTEQIENDQRDTELTERYRNIYEQPIVGLAFFDKDGYLLNVNEKTRELMKFLSERDPYYYDTPLFDVPVTEYVPGSISDFETTLSTIKSEKSGYTTSAEVTNAINTLLAAVDTYFTNCRPSDNDKPADLSFMWQNMSLASGTEYWTTSAKPVYGDGCYEKARIGAGLASFDSWGSQGG